MSVYLLATLDTKGREADFIRELLRQAEVAVTLVDAGCLGTAAVAADVTREALFAEGGYDLASLVSAAERGQAVTAAADSAAKLIARLHAAGQVDGVLAIGGSAGTTIGTAAMRVLPLGVPKLMLSTLASGQVRQFVGDKDILMLNSVVDISGVNRISRATLANAAWAMAGMVRFGGRPHEGSAWGGLPRPSEFEEGPERADGLGRPPHGEQHRAAEPADRPLIAATMFGVTTPCVEHARKLLEEAGYEVLVFHATGNGGQAMESLVADGLIAGVLDMTTTELADELVGGFLTAGPDRLTAAAGRGVPQVVSVGATDMVNFYAPESVPARFAGRKFYRHNANVTLMRTTESESAAIGADIGRKLAAASGPVAVVLPRRGVSALDCEGQPFCDAAAREAMFDALRSAACDRFEIVELDLHINDREFAEAAAMKLLQLLRPSCTD
ncbi:MAG TPA: Tm-1-like ATP-binding domain-containing protein [Pirellulales bacterium]|nr:Tm-1-like ATP-binding domain-containing protein [Pirellulales bacterium]HVA45908.1 Tm-1-like ATP-binding domain-containing protein [Pirellulales bacterium]